MTTRYRKPVYATQMSTVTLECNTLAVNTTISLPSTLGATDLAAGAVTLGTASNLDTTSKLDGVYLSYVINTGLVTAMTHGLGAIVKGWWPVNRTGILASQAVIWCSDIATSTTTLSLNSLGTTTFKIFAF